MPERAKILLVSPDSALRKGIKRNSRENHHIVVSEARTPTQALKRIERSPDLDFQVVIIDDLNTINQDGPGRYQFVEVLKQRATNIRIIRLSVLEVADVDMANADISVGRAEISELGRIITDL